MRNDEGITMRQVEKVDEANTLSDLQELSNLPEPRLRKPIDYILSKEEDQIFVENSSISAITALIKDAEEAALY